MQEIEVRNTWNLRAQSLHPWDYEVTDLPLTNSKSEASCNATGLFYFLIV